MPPCEVTRVEKIAPNRVLREEQAFAEMFLSHLLARTMRVEEDLVDQLFNSTEKRLARTLLLANFGKDGRPEPILAKISQETLAEMIGTTRSRVFLSDAAPAFLGKSIQESPGRPRPQELQTMVTGVGRNEAPNKGRGICVRCWTIESLWVPSGTGGNL